MNGKDLRALVLTGILVLLLTGGAGAEMGKENDSGTGSPALPESAQAQMDYARSKLASAGQEAELSVVESLKHPEAFRIRAESGRTVIKGGSSAGVIYGSDALIEGDYLPGRIEKPDFTIRGTTLCMMPGRYTATISEDLYPWFYDRAFMIRTLDAFAAARLNTIFLWAGHIFPYIVEMPKYPEASADITTEQLKANQAQFLWFTTECGRRNIRVLVHFYNIHVSPPFADKHGIGKTNPRKPTPLLREYMHYALSRYFEEFPAVGLYACPGESLRSEHHLEWFRDVIFDAAKKSGKNPVIVIRDWTMNMDFRNQIKSLYDNVYTELKHNDESLTSPYPDVRHMQLECVANKGHIVNAAHGPAEDLVPMRWASPSFIREAAACWKKLGFVTGVEFYGLSFWDWPYSFDKVEAGEAGAVEAGEGHRLISLDRDAPYYSVFGRYLWKIERNQADESAFWTRYMARRFGSEKIGRLIARWYVVAGSISPGIQNLNATRVANFWSSVLLMNQRVDDILRFNKSLAETPYTLHRETGRAKQRFYPRPFDNEFFQRYRKEYGLPMPGDVRPMYPEFEPFKTRMGVESLEQRHCMPVSEYAEYLERGEPVTWALAPDKVVQLLHVLACESLEIARQAESAADDPVVKQELHRFVTDSEMYVLATEALTHKENAALLKARMLLSKSADMADEFILEMEASVKAYEELANLTIKTYLFANDLRKYHWSVQGIEEFRADLEDQRKWLELFRENIGESVD